MYLVRVCTTGPIFSLMKDRSSSTVLPISKLGPIRQYIVNNIFIKISNLTEGEY
jgi:hypothetical protein